MWLDTENGMRLDILDGFKPNQGAVLVIRKLGDTSIGHWQLSNGEFVLKLNFSKRPVKFLSATQFSIRDQVFTRKEEFSDSQVVTLKGDESGFIQRLTSLRWTTSKEGGAAIFKSTFANDSGVAEFYDAKGKLQKLTTWGISSNVLRIGNTTLVEARASQTYLVGLSDRDRFTIYRASASLAPSVRTSLDKQRKAFLDALVTDAWSTVRFGNELKHRFRPVESELKGRLVTTKAGRLSNSAVWEYSPSSGALKIGHTDYVGGVLVGGTLALLRSNAKQVFYKRRAGGRGRKFTIADVTTLPIAENEASKIRALFQGQFQRGDYLYTFEFAKNNLNGFVHKFRSEPFTIAGQRISNDLVGRRKVAYAFEDLLALDEALVLKRDMRESRLRAKTDDEARTDMANAKKSVAAALTRTLVVRVRTRSGDTIDLPLPLSNFGQIAELQILAE